MASRAAKSMGGSRASRASTEAQRVAMAMLTPTPGPYAQRGPVTGYKADHSRAFALDGTEAITSMKELVDDAEDGNPASMPRLVRFKSYSRPYMAVIKSGFGQSAEVNQYEVPGGSLSSLCPGMIEVVCYGRIETKAYALFSRTVTGASVEILPGLGHVPSRPPQSDQVSLVPNAADAPGDWTVVGALTSGFAPGGRFRLDLFTLGGPVEFGWFDSTSPTNVQIGGFTVDGKEKDLRHTGALKLKARHPGGAPITDSRTAFAVWTR